MFQKIKLQMMRTVANEDEIVEVQEMAAAVMHAAKKTLISQVMKRNVIENIVPIVIALKHMVIVYFENLVDIGMLTKRLADKSKTPLRRRA